MLSGLAEISLAKGHPNPESSWAINLTFRVNKWYDDTEIMD